MLWIYRIITILLLMGHSLMAATMPIENIYHKSVDPEFKGPSLLQLSFKTVDGKVQKFLYISGITYDPN